MNTYAEARQYYYDILQHHIANWKQATRFSACIETAHPSYQAIIALGAPVLPALFAEMRQRPGWYFEALRQITGATPERLPDHAGRLKQLTADWLA